MEMSAALNISRLPSAFRRVSTAPAWLSRRIGRFFVRLANGLRDAGRWSEAARLYQVALVLVPKRGDWAIQAGNCFKEAGRYERAIALYLRADGAHLAEACFQRGDALARGGAIVEAVDALEEASQLGHLKAEARLAEVSGCGLVSLRNEVSREATRLHQPLDEAFLLNRLTRGLRTRRWLGSLDQSRKKKRGAHDLERDQIILTHIGRLRVRNNGRLEPLLVGIVCVRARIVSKSPIRVVHLCVGQKIIAQQEPVEILSEGRRQYAVNIWLDSGAIRAGRQAIILKAVDTNDQQFTVKAIVNIMRATAALNLEESDSFVPSAVVPRGGDSVQEVVKRPTMMRSAARRLISRPVRRVLAIRADQLGDLSASLSAIKSLREVFPEAHITFMAAPGIAEVVLASGLCDDVVHVSLIYDSVVEKRYLSVEEERRLCSVFSQVNFDVAIDLCPGEETRPLLKLTNANFLIGFNPREFDYLDFGIDVISRDKSNRLAILSHAASVKMLVDCLGEALSNGRASVPRLKDDAEILSSYGLEANNYIAIHTGARHEINRWPISNFLALAESLVETLGVKVVMFVDDVISQEEMVNCRNLSGIDFHTKLPFDQFDAVISNASVMVGNDSGPKHLAASRGVQTVAIQVNRLNWNEWGQDGRGLILTKRVPCAGCGLNDVAMCAKDVACLRSITVQDALAAVNECWRISKQCGSVEKSANSN